MTDVRGIIMSRVKGNSVGAGPRPRPGTRHAPHILISVARHRTCGLVRRATARARPSGLARLHPPTVPTDYQGYYARARRLASGRIRGSPRPGRSSKGRSSASARPKTASGFSNSTRPSASRKQSCCAPSGRRSTRRCSTPSASSANTSSRTSRPEEPTVLTEPMLLAIYRFEVGDKTASEAFFAAAHFRHPRRRSLRVRSMRSRRHGSNPIGSGQNTKCGPDHL